MRVKTSSKNGGHFVAASMYYPNSMLSDGAIMPQRVQDISGVTKGFIKYRLQLTAVLGDKNTQQRHYK